MKDGETLEAVFPYDAGTIINADGASIFQAVQEQARETGFRIDLIPVAASDTWSGAYSTAQEYSYDLKAGYWTSVNAGILYINWRQSTEDDPNFANSAFYDDPELEAIIEEANSASDIEAQNALYGEAQEAHRRARDELRPVRPAEHAGRQPAARGRLAGACTGRTDVL